MNRKMLLGVVASVLLVGATTAGCSSTTNRSAAGVSSEPSAGVTAGASQSASAEVSTQASPDVVAPAMPRVTWVAQGHQVTLNLREGRNSSPVKWFESTFAERDKQPDLSKNIQRCDVNTAGATTTECPLASLKRGNWDIFIRAVNDAGASDWIQGASASVNSCSYKDAQAGVCQVYDKGPGGGLIVYDAGSRQGWGQYLEVAPSGWSGSSQDPQVQWCSKNSPGYNNLVATQTTLGSGAANTAQIIKDCGQSSAAGRAASYRGGGLDDWFLPSSEESVLMYNKRSEVGGIPDSGGYWTSSQDFSKGNGDSQKTTAFELTMIWRTGGYTPGTTMWASKDNSLSVRPFRAL